MTSNTRLIFFTAKFSIWRISDQLVIQPLSANNAGCQAFFIFHVSIMVCCIYVRVAPVFIDAFANAKAFFFRNFFSFHRENLLRNRLGQFPLKFRFFSSQFQWRLCERLGSQHVRLYLVYLKSFFISIVYSRCRFDFFNCHLKLL